MSCTTHHICDCKSAKLMELEEQVKAYKQIIEHKQKTIDTMNHLLMDKGIIFNFDSVDALWEQLQQATENYWDRLEERLKVNK